MSTPHVTVTTGYESFGGTRIVDGISTATAWSDGVVIAHAWTMEPTSLIHDAIFTFRGTVARGSGYVPSSKWVLRHEDGTFMDTFNTRHAAVEHARIVAIHSAFRGLNAAERAS